jgi:hypothetical protein
LRAITCFVSFVEGVLKSKIICSSCVYYWLSLFESRCIDGLLWLTFCRAQFRLFLNDFCLQLIVEGNSLTGYWWFDMRLFGFFDELWMIKSSLTNKLILRTYWKELSVFLGSGCWWRNWFRIVCIMSSMLPLRLYS